VWLGKGDLLGAGSAFAMVSSALHNAARMQPGEAPEVRRRKLEDRIARHVAEQDCARVAAFLGEIAGAPFPDGELSLLRSARANPALMAEQVGRAFVDLLAAECAAGPVLLALEDLHWGDLPSVKLIDAALTKLQDSPLMVLALARPEVHDHFPKLWVRRHAQEIRLAGLTRRAAEGLVRDALGRAVAAEVVDRIVERAAGNAFYLEELIRAVAEGRGEDMPETVLAMAQARLDALDPDDRRLLRAASVFGETLWTGGALALLGDQVGPRGVERLAAMVEREILIRREESRFPGEDEFAFRHALLREGAYSTLTDDDRALGHRLAGAWLEERGEGDPMVMAHHFEKGGEPRRAEIHCLRASRQAFMGNDLAAAAARAEQGLRLGEAGEHRLDLLNALGMARHTLGDLDGSLAIVDEMLRLAPPGGRIACAALAGKLVIAQQRGMPHVFVEVMDALRDVPLTPENAGPLMQIYWVLLAALSVVGLFDRVEHYFERFEQAAPMVSPLDLAAQSCICAIRAERAMLFEGDIEESVKLLERGAACCDEAGNRGPAVVQRSHAGQGYRVLGAYDRSEELLRRARAASSGTSIEGWLARILLSWTLADRGAREEAVAEAERTLGEGKDSTEMAQQGVSRLVLAHALRLRGDLDAAAREAEAALSFPPMMVLQRPTTLATLAAVRLAQGRAGEALAAAEEVLRAIDSSPVRLLNEALARRVHAEALLAAGDHDAARAALAKARDRLLAVAAKIHDPELRRSFLEDVADNVSALRLAAEWVGPG
jgi:tetratricopeptide (TPR) repeat protein